MKAETVIEVVKKLVGEVDAVGSTYLDNERFENLKVMTRVVDELIEEIIQASKTKDYVQYSMKKIGTHAYKFLEDLKVRCDEIVGETE